MVKHGVEAEELQAYLDGELGPARQAEVGRHLRECQECAALVEDLRRVSATLKQWQVDEAPASLRLPVVERQQVERRWLRWRPAWALAAVAAVVMVVALVSVPNLQRWERGLPEPEEIAQEIVREKPVLAEEQREVAAKRPQTPQASEPAPGRVVAPKQARQEPERSAAIERTGEVQDYDKRADVPAAAPLVVSEGVVQEEDAQLETQALCEFEAKDELAKRVVGEVAGGEVGGRVESRAREATVAADKAAPMANRLVAKRKAALRMIAYQVNLTLEVKEFEAAKEKVYQAVEEAGGYIAQASTAETPDQPQRADLRLRVPVEQLSAVLEELRGLGRVVKEQLSTQEVSEQAVDLEARLRNARTTEQRLIAVLKERTGKVRDILEVEKEIARTRQEIESMEAQRHNLMNRVALATVQVTLLEEFEARLEPTPVGTGTRLRNAFIEGYENFVGTLLGFAFFFARHGLNLLFWGGLVWLTWRALRRTLLGRLAPTAGLSPSR